MIAIIDYGMGNLRSVQKGFEKVGHQAAVTSDPAVSRRPKKSCCPASGRSRTPSPNCAAADWSAGARGDRLGQAVPGHLPGAAIALRRSYENGGHEGLGVLPGEVVRFQVPAEYTVPHMGWNQLAIRRRPAALGRAWTRALRLFRPFLLRRAGRPAVIATETDYGGPFCSMIWRDKSIATQFHPEKSQADGLRMLRNFAELSCRKQALRANFLLIATPGVVSGAGTVCVSGNFAPSCKAAAARCRTYKSLCLCSWKFCVILRFAD